MNHKKKTKLAYAESVALDPYVSQGDDARLETVEDVHGNIGDFQRLVNRQHIHDDVINEGVNHELPTDVRSHTDADHDQAVENHNDAHDQGKMDDLPVFLDACRPGVRLDQKPAGGAHYRLKF